MKFCDSSEDREAGFTLVELLVSLGLLALMATYALTTIQRFSDLRRLESIASDNERIQRVDRHLRQSLAGMRMASFSGNAERTAYVQTGNGLLRIANVLDDRLVSGRLHVLTYMIDGESLALSYRGVGEPEASVDEDIQLLTGIKRVTFSFGKEGETKSPPFWQTDWSLNQAPSAVAVFLEAADPVKVIEPIYVSVETSAGYN